MSFLTTSVLSVLLSATALLTSGGNSSLAGEIPVYDWVPEAGDVFLVDTQKNFGYLVHADGIFTSFPVATGQKRYVSYIGRSYFAATPNWDWTVRSKEIKGDRITYGPTGRFLRLFKDDERTAYGIHEYAYEDKMFSENGRFGSMGCIIVRREVMDIMESTFSINNKELQVKTVHGLDSLQIAQKSLSETF